MVVDPPAKAMPTSPHPKLPESPPPKLPDSPADSPSGSQASLETLEGTSTAAIALKLQTAEKSGASTPSASRASARAEGATPAARAPLPSVDIASQASPSPSPPPTLESPTLAKAKAAAAEKDAEMPAPLPVAAALPVAAEKSAASTPSTSGPRPTSQRYVPPDVPAEYVLVPGTVSHAVSDAKKLFDKSKSIPSFHPASPLAHQGSHANLAAFASPTGGHIKSSGVACGPDAPAAPAHEAAEPADARPTISTGTAESNLDMSKSPSSRKFATVKTPRLGVDTRALDPSAVAAAEILHETGKPISELIRIHEEATHSAAPSLSRKPSVMSPGGVKSSAASAAQSVLD